MIPLLINAQTIGLFLLVSMSTCPMNADSLFRTLGTSGHCAVSGRIFEPASAIRNVTVELIGREAQAKQKSKVVDGSFEFQAVRPGKYELRVVDRTGTILMKQTEQLKGTGDYVRIRLPLAPLKSLNVVAVHQLLHETDRQPLKIFQKGVEALQLGDMAGAIGFFHKAVLLNPSFAAAHMNMIVPYLSLRQEDNALEHARAAYELDPKSFQTGYNLAATLIVVHHFAEAESVVRSLSVNDLTSCKREMLLALSLFGQGDRTEEALQHLKRASVEFPAARLMAIDLLAGIGQIATAESQAREYMESAASDCERMVLQKWINESAQARIASAQ